MLKLSIDARRYGIAFEPIIMHCVEIKTLAAGVGVARRLEVCQSTADRPVDSRVAFVPSRARIHCLCTVQRAQDQKYPEDAEVF